MSTIIAGSFLFLLSLYLSSDINTAALFLNMHAISITFGGVYVSACQNFAAIQKNLILPYT